MNENRSVENKDKTNKKGQTQDLTISVTCSKIKNTQTWHQLTSIKRIKKVTTEIQKDKNIWSKKKVAVITYKPTFKQNVYCTFTKGLKKDLIRLKGICT